MIVVGGGVTGAEYTCMFAALGLRVTMVGKPPGLPKFGDQEIVQALRWVPDEGGVEIVRGWVRGEASGRSQWVFQR